jgi:hypothetical protein
VPTLSLAVFLASWSLVTTYLGRSAQLFELPRPHHRRSYPEGACFFFTLSGTRYRGSLL